MYKRDSFFDNAKFILIVLVVFGHMIETFIEDNVTVYAIYKVIYSFHMPAFILVSGFFTKGIYKKGISIKSRKN